MPADDRDIAIGINDRRDLQEAQRKFNLRAQQRLMLENGVTILQPETVTIEHGVEIGRDTVIYPCTYLGAGTRHRQKLRDRPVRLPEKRPRQRRRKAGIR